MADEKKVWTASEIKELILKKQHFAAIEHKILVPCEKGECEVADEKVLKALQGFRKACRNVDKVIKAAIAREKQA